MERTPSILRALAICSRQAASHCRGHGHLPIRRDQTASKRIKRCLFSSSSSSSSGGDLLTADPSDDDIHAAEPIDMDEGAAGGGAMRGARVVPASPSYFSGSERFWDHFLAIEAAYIAHRDLPTISPGPRIAWNTAMTYRTTVGEKFTTAEYGDALGRLKFLNRIQPALMPADVPRLSATFMRAVQPDPDAQRPILVDALGRARAVGRRKSSTAVAWLVEGDGEVLVNGRSLTDYFGRVHQRESAVWPLLSTDRMDKYNLWAQVGGGGTTGQAEALTLAVAKALLVHEPPLKPVLRKAGCVTRDRRTVERKKPGKYKARAMPQWNAR